ncbi:MAG: ABC transporter ATP-binding protein/permease [Christensenellaceae bacterium]|jgi:ATP-binding cassette subfamily B protein|nr:ABC transporter ATP-binding protein/permease [Christensenellaceae bacterium]
MKTKEKPTHTIWQYVRPVKWTLFFYLFLHAISIGLSLVATILYSNFLGEAFADNGILHSVVLLLLGILGIKIFRMVFEQVGGILSEKITREVSLYMKLDLLNHTFRISSKSFGETSSTKILDRVTASNDVINSILRIIGWIAELISNLVMAVYVILINWQIGLIALGLNFLVFQLRGIVNTLRKLFDARMRKKRASVNSLMHEIIKSERDIKGLDLEENIKPLVEMENTKLTNENKKNFYKMLPFKAMFQTFDIVNDTILLLVLFVLFQEKAIVISSVMFLNSRMGSSYGAFSLLDGIRETLATLSVSKRRMMELFNEKRFATEKFGELVLDKVDGNIEFNNVVFSYADVFVDNDAETQEDLEKEKISVILKQRLIPFYRHIQDKKRREKRRKERAEREQNIKYNEVLKGISFKIEANTTVALAGLSGSGKTTALNLMAKFYDVDSGEVLLDGHNINTLSKDTIRSNISIVNQSPYLFDASIVDNLTFIKKDATEEEIADVLEKVCLTTFVAGLSKGIHTRVGEGGIKLSGGQRQRLSIARALLKGSKVIIFDEATSSLDNITQEEIKDAIANLSGSHTVIIVAHRLSTIKDCDNILFLDNGQIADQGKFRELIKTCDTFKKLFDVEQAEERMADA